MLNLRLACRRAMSRSCSYVYYMNLQSKVNEYIVPTVQHSISWCRINVMSCNILQRTVGGTHVSLSLSLSLSLCVCVTVCVCIFLALPRSLPLLYFRINVSLQYRPFLIILNPSRFGSSSSPNNF